MHTHTHLYSHECPKNKKAEEAQDAASVKREHTHTHKPS